MDAGRNPDGGLVVLLDEAALDEYTDRFTHDAFRYETLTRYDVESDGGEFARYLAGEPGPDPAVTGPWGDWVRAQLARGAQVRRLRVLTEVPGDYLRFEMDWFYTANGAAGEQIRVLDLTERARPHGVALYEFWMLDGERAVLMQYDKGGRFLHGVVADAATVKQVRRARDVAWDAAEPFPEWWARHPQYRRASVGA